MPKLKVNGTELYCESHGEGDPVVLLQGFGGNLRIWAPLLPIFSPKYRVITYDWRGTGQSAEPETGYTTNVLADDLAGLLDALGIDRAHIVGRSMGGCIAQYLAINHPEKVRSLVLASSWGRADAFLKRALLARVAMLEAAGYETLQYHNNFLWAFSRKFFEKECEEIRNEVTEVVASAVKAGQPAKSFKKLGVAGGEHDATRELYKVKAPTLVMAGRDDILTPVDMAEELYLLIPKAKLLIYECVRHAFYEEIPLKFADDCMNFWMGETLKEVAKT